ncbi:kinetochore protein Spc25 [Penicillium chermesinum]|nr:kinetochore protein Spc25 [Penicillium chermesinum]
MASSFEPSLSTSGMRPPLASADAPSMADSLPSINFGFEDLRNRMTQFTAKFDAFIERGRKQVLEEKNQFRINLAELQEDDRMRQRDIEIINSKSQTHEQILQKESAEAAEMHAAISSITLEHDTRLTKQDHWRLRRFMLSSWMHNLVSNNPELEFWHDKLCLRIEGAGREDRLKFIYSHISEKDWEYEAWFELGTASRDYEVFHTRPKLDREALEREIDIVNDDRNFGEFLKRMRKLFVETLK